MEYKMKTIMFFKLPYSQRFFNVANVVKIYVENDNVVST